MNLIEQWLEAGTLSDVVYTASDLGELALLGTALLELLAASRRSEFHQALHDRYRELTQAGLPDGPPGR